MDILVFPKTYERTKDSWQEGNIVCIVGKTPREPGENKLFVEKVFVLNKENVHSLCRQLSLNSSNSNNEKETKFITIALTRDELKNKSEDMRKIFEDFPGDHQVFVKVVDKTIQTKFLVDNNLDLQNALEEILGEGKII